MSHNIFVDGSNVVCYMDNYLKSHELKMENTKISRNAFKKFRWNPEKIVDIILQNGRHMKYKYDNNLNFNMYFASSISCRFSYKLEKIFNKLGFNTYRENHTFNDKELKVDTYLHNCIIERSCKLNNRSVFYIVTGDVNEENKFNFPQIVKILASKGIYVSILTPGRPHYKFLDLEKQYPNLIQVRAFFAKNIMRAMIHKNLLE